MVEMETTDARAFEPNAEEMAVDTNTTDVQSGAMEDGELPSAETPSFFEYDARTPVKSLLTASHEFNGMNHAVSGHNNFTKGVKVSPDGLCMLTSSEDHILRIFELPSEENADVEQLSILQAKEGGAVYDYAWYPYMTSQDPATCIFISTSRDHPIHMWDAYTGQLRATYRAFDHLDEITAAFSVAFNATGDKIFAGYDRMIRFFDITQPSRDFVSRPLCKTRKSRDGQRGIISTLHFNPDHSKIYAAGSYNGTTCIYTEDTGEELLCLRDHDGHGITQVQFSPDGRYLFTGARRDGSIHCWDIRQSVQVVQSFTRQAETNQRVEFDLHCTGRYLATGSRDGRALLYDVSTGELVDENIRMPDAVNGVSFFPDATRGRVAVTTGQRHYDLPDDSDSDDDEDDNAKKKQEQSQRNALRVFEFGCK
ncbi:hypothetical protein Poli38472_013973 [Pythium oligandrum]|uniref:Telomerase Cajal body protein 1 n=1 Tax=Pythium oligandrum TaxID=41045 RepID=A0A8K1FL14_PYTOL|nr:hypothetical protein Poli38472_013973 [Pythium oligandrum]|eukprot:TMW66661.1 hypothetical protein Poli38472_013973 [Pythium oligandrum]